MNERGITRKKRGVGKRSTWDYFDSRGKRITDEKIVARCNQLVLPPAWADVWISPNARADLQATGVDAKGRRQYRYHAAWTKARAAEKFDSMTSFAKILPTIRKKVAADLSAKGMPRNKVVALIVRLIDLYHFRVGNDEYARTNKSYGLTTLKEGHMVVDRSRKAEGKYDAVFEFVGKSGKLWKRRIWEDDLVALIIASGKVGGSDERQDLFRYEDDGGADHDVKSNHINEYLDAITKGAAKVTAKDFRTWAATWKTAHRLAEQIDPDTARREGKSRETSSRPSRPISAIRPRFARRATSTPPSSPGSTTAPFDRDGTTRDAGPPCPACRRPKRRRCGTFHERRLAFGSCAPPRGPDVARALGFVVPPRARRSSIERKMRAGMRGALSSGMRSLLRFGVLTSFVVAAGCSHGAKAPTGARASHGDALVVRAASCWLGGLWSDALGEKKLAWTDTRTPGIAARCKDALDDPGMRGITPRAEDLLARKLDTEAERTLLHEVAAAARENTMARRAADRVKVDSADDTTTPTERRDDKLFAAPQLRKADALVALMNDAGPYAADARAIALLLAVDRVEIARGLPKHLKIEVLATPCREVFGVAAPELPHDDAAPIPTGTWLSYLSVAADAAGHAVPPEASTDPAHREPLAWNGLLDGFADKLRVLEPRVGAPELGQVVGVVAARLDDQYRGERTVALSYAKKRGA